MYSLLSTLDRIRCTGDEAAGPQPCPRPEDWGTRVRSAEGAGEARGLSGAGCDRVFGEKVRIRTEVMWLLPRKDCGPGIHTADCATCVRMRHRGHELSPLKVEAGPGPPRRLQRGPARPPLGRGGSSTGVSGVGAPSSLAPTVVPFAGRWRLDCRPPRPPPAVVRVRLRPPSSRHWAGPCAAQFLFLRYSFEQAKAQLALGAWPLHAWTRPTWTGAFGGGGHGVRPAAAVSADTCCRSPSFPEPRDSGPHGIHTLPGVTTWRWSQACAGVRGGHVPTDAST